MEDLLLHAAAIETGGYPDLTESHYQDLRDFIDAAGGQNRKIRVHMATGRAVSGILEQATRERCRSDCHGHERPVGLGEGRARILNGGCRSSGDDACPDNSAIRGSGKSTN